MASERPPIRDVLERVLYTQFDDPAADFISGFTEVWIGVAIRVKRELQVVIAVCERQQGMVHEVERRRPELQALVLRDSDVLHHGQVAVPEHRAWQIGHATCSQASRGRGLEAGRIDELVVRPLGGIANDQWIQGNIRGTE